MTNIYAELSTIRDYIRYAASSFNEHGLFFGHGTENAWDDASLLVLRALHLPNDIDRTILDARLTKKEQLILQALIEKRVSERVPVPYLIKEAWFAGLSFYVDERVLIPRSPIAELIGNYFKPWVNPYKVKRILDLCTGSACIAVACALQFPDAVVDASDISEDALSVAKINVLRHKVDDQVNLYHSDLFAKLPEERYDIIISNPPYVTREEMNELPAEYRHEPPLGLAAGIEGLDIVIRILSRAEDFLTPDGVLIVEVGNSAENLMNRFSDIPFTWLEFNNDSQGIFLLTAEQIKAYKNQFNNEPPY